jgi:hypothetical protein
VTDTKLLSESTNYLPGISSISPMAERTSSLLTDPVLILIDFKYLICKVTIVTYI